MILRLFFLAFICSSAYSQLPDYSICYNKTSVTRMSPNIFGGLDGFYDIVKGISDGLQGTMSNDTLQDIYNFIQGTNSKSTGEIISDIVNDQIGSIIFFCVGLLIILIAFVIGFSVCCARCCCCCCVPGPNAERSKVFAALMGIGLIIGFAFISTGVIIFNLSAENLYSSINGSPQKIGIVALDTVDVVTVGSNEMICTVGAAMSSALTTIGGQVQAFPANTIQQINDDTGLDNFENFNFTYVIGVTNDSINNLCPTLEFQCGDANDQTINGVCKVLEHTLTVLQYAQTVANDSQVGISIFNQTMESNVQSILQAMQTVNSSANTVINGLNKEIVTLSDFITKIQTDINKTQSKIVDWDGYDPVRASLQAAVSIPNVLAMFFAIITIIALILWLFCSTTMKAFGWISAIGFYVVIFFVWLAMGLACVMFIGGWALSGVCKPVFQDPSFNIYGVLNNNSFTIPGMVSGSSSIITIQHLMLQCQNNATVFAAINGQQLLNTEIVNEVLNTTALENQLLSTLNQATAFFNATWNASLATSIDQGLTALQGASTSLSTASCPTHQSLFDGLKTNMQIILVQMQNLTSIANYINSKMPGAPDQLTAYFMDQFNITSAQINASVSNLVDQLSTNTFPCGGLYNSYENAGFVLCDYLGRPIQGMWGAAGLAALFLIPLAILLLCSSSVLKSRPHQDYKYHNSAEYLVDQTDRGAWEDDPLSRPTNVVNQSSYNDPYATESWARPGLATATVASSGSGLRQSEDPDSMNDYGYGASTVASSGLKRTYPDLDDNSSNPPKGLRREAWDSDTVSHGSGLRRVDVSSNSSSGLQRF